MSRFELTIPNSTLTVAYGVDHVTSTFVNIRDTSWDEDVHEDYYVLSVSNMGIEARDDLTDQQRHCVNRFKDRFTLAKKQGNAYPNLAASDILDILHSFGTGYPDSLDMEVYKNLD